MIRLFSSIRSCVRLVTVLGLALTAGACFGGTLPSYHPGATLQPDDAVICPTAWADPSKLGDGCTFPPDPWELGDGCTFPPDPWELGDGCTFPPDPWELGDGCTFPPDPWELGDGCTFPPNPWELA